MPKLAAWVWVQFLGFVTSHSLLQSVCSSHKGQGHLRCTRAGAYREVGVFRLQVVCDVLDTLSSPCQGGRQGQAVGRCFGAEGSERCV